MHDTVFVLLIEDSEDDAFVIQRELEAAGYLLYTERVETAGELCAALDRRSWDLIVADYRLPAFNAPAALAIVRARTADLPFIIVSGTIGEETAIECMRAGANDFLIKGHTARLPFVVERELQVTRQRQLHQQSERRMAQLFSASPIPMSVTRVRDSRIIEVNPAYVELSQYSAEELRGRTVTQLDLWDDVGERQRFLEALGASLPVRNFEFKARTKSGAIRDALVSADILDFNGEPCVLSMIVDITERKRVEEQYRLQAQLLNIIGQAVIVTDHLGTVSYWNHAAEAMYGWSAAEMVGNSLMPILPNDDQIGLGTQIMESVFQGNSWSGEFSVRRRDGSVFPVLVTDTPLMNEAGEVTSVIGVSADLTELKRVEQQQREEEELHRLILSNISDAVFVTDDSGAFTFICPNVESIFGYSVAEVAEFGTIQRLFGGVVVQMDELDQIGELVNLECQITDKAGVVRDLLVSIKRADIKSGTVLYVGRDVTERQRALQALEESELRFRMITENSSDLYSLTDSNGICVYASPAYKTVLGYKPERLLGTRLREKLVHPDDVAKLDNWHYQPVVRVRLHMANGEWRWMESSTYPIQLADGEYIVGVTRDLTERLQLENERLERERLQIELQEQKEVSDLKSRFVSMVSHEFRTPLAAIQTSSDLLSRYLPRMSEQQRADHLYRIGDQIANLVNLLDEVLTLSKADSVGIDFEPAPTNVSALCHEVAQSVERAMRADGEILINTPPSALTAELDVKLFREALTNLLSNAIKYSPPGVPVNLNVREARGELIVQVKDHGIGIPEEDQMQLFEAFHRAKNVGAIAGTGLGLAIVKRAIDAHGGSVSVQSEVGVGTEFALRLPLTQAKGQKNDARAHD